MKCNTAFALISLSIAAGFRSGNEPERIESPQSLPRTLASRVTYAFELSPPADAKKIQLWVPIPETNEFQTISNLEIDPKAGESKRDPMYNNLILYIEPKAAAAPLKYTIKFDVVRKEERAHLEKEISPELSRRLLEGDRLGEINESIRDMARKATTVTRSTSEAARRIYDFVLNRMQYSKEGTGWGRGDVKWACDSKYGNCADFHSVFIAMARATGIPARFHYGFTLKPDGTTAPHCWAQYFDREKGWVPVDISEARKVLEKEPAKRDYYFGTLSENRFLLSTGRDIVLEPKQSGEPLNFMYAPYAEADGKPVDVKLEVTHAAKK